MQKLIENAKIELRRDLPQSRRRISERCAGWDDSGAEAQCRTRKLLVRFRPPPSGQEVIEARFVNGGYQKFVPFSTCSGLKFFKMCRIFIGITSVLVSP